MNNLKFRHSTINSQNFLFSSKGNNEEPYLVSYDLVKKLLVGMAKRSRVFNSGKYDISDYPFTYRERQLDSILLPELSKLCNGYVFAEYPVTRNSKRYEADNSKGRIDYWCIYKGYSFVIELKHSYDNFRSETTKAETIRRWKTMNKYQLSSIRQELRNFAEKTNGVIPLALHFITSEVSGEPTNELFDEYVAQERDNLIRIYNDLKKIAEPDFLSLWELDKQMYKNSLVGGFSYPGLILISKFYNPISHIGKTN